MRGSPQALKPLLATKKPAAISAMRHLPPAAVPQAIPVLIENLTHPEHQVRALSEFQLHRWTGQAFDRDWTGYRWQRPTRAEGRRMQPKWRRWWKEHEADWSAE